MWRAVPEGSRLRPHYTDRGGAATLREVEPFHVVLGPDGQYLTAWCHLRGDERVFRMDRITAAERAPGPRVAERPSHVCDLPAAMVRRASWE
ncbi:MAG: WYL domain-containing protein [Nocardioides sp.]